MTKYRLKHSFLFSLVIAFLAMQWTTTHIHLAEHHDHNGKHHNHSAKVHVHKSIDDSVNEIDFSTHSDGLSTVELDYEFNITKTEKLDKTPVSVLLRRVPYFTINRPIIIEYTEDSESRLSFYYHLTPTPRAPPAFS